MSYSQQQQSQSQQPQPNSVGDDAVQLIRLKARVSELEEQFAHIRQECNARVLVLEEALQREQSRNRDREDRETAKRQELISKVNSLTEDRALLKAQLGQQRDVEDEMTRTKSDLKEARKENLELKTKSLDDRRNFDEQLRDRQRMVERQAQDISDLQCKLAIVEHKLNLAVARLSQNDSQAEALTDLEEQSIRLSEKLKAVERDRRNEKESGNSEKAALRQQIRQLEAELLSERDGASKADIISDYEAKIEGAHRMLRNAFASGNAGGGGAGGGGGGGSGGAASTPTQTQPSGRGDGDHGLSVTVSSSSPGALHRTLAGGSGPMNNNRAASFRGRGLNNASSNNNNNNNIGQVFGASATDPMAQSMMGFNNTHNTVDQRSTGSSTPHAPGGGGTSSVGGGASLAGLSEALHMLDDPGRAENLLRRFIDSAVAARSATAHFTAASGLPDPSSTDRAAIMVQLANVTAERDMLRAKLQKERDTSDTVSLVRGAPGMLPTSKSPPKLNTSA